MTHFTLIFNLPKIVPYTTVAIESLMYPSGVYE